MTGLHTVQSRREFAFKNSQSPVERKKIVRVDPKFGIRLRIGRPGRRASAEPQCHVSICPQLASSFTNYKLVDYLPNLYNYINCNLFSLRLYRTPSISAGVALGRISRGFSLRLSKRPSWRPSQRPSQRLSQAAARLYHRRSGHRPAISAAISPPGYRVTLTNLQTLPDRGRRWPCNQRTIDSIHSTTVSADHNRPLQPEALLSLLICSLFEIDDCKHIQSHISTWNLFHCTIELNCRVVVFLCLVLLLKAAFATSARVFFLLANLSGTCTFAFLRGTASMSVSPFCKKKNIHSSSMLSPRKHFTGTPKSVPRFNRPPVCPLGLEVQKRSVPSEQTRRPPLFLWSLFLLFYCKILENSNLFPAVSPMPVQPFSQPDDSSDDD